jgi:hypothetical protein
MTADDFVGELHQYIHEQEMSPLYGRSFFDGVMAGKVDRGALKKWAIQHHYRTGQHVRALGSIPQHGIERSRPDYPTAHRP